MVDVFQTLKMLKPPGLIKNYKVTGFSYRLYIIIMNAITE